MAKQTVLYKAHIDHCGKMVEFSDWDMPLNYGSQIAEHQAVRNNVGMFDVSHMAAVDIIGSDAIKFISYLLANDITKITRGKAIYSCMLNDAGGIVDDLITYRLDDYHCRVVFNAGCYAKDLAWVTKHARSFSVTINDISHNMAIIALQGPQAVNAVKKVFSNSDELLALAPFSLCQQDNILVGRTGYTGEDGFEFILPNKLALDLWHALKIYGVIPCGLGARDSLRLEAGMRLYGSDMDENHNPLDSALKWTVSLTHERDFIGRSAIESLLSDAPPPTKLVGLTLLGRGVLRHGQKVHTSNGFGIITSGIFSPTLQKSIAFARVPKGDYQECQVEIRDKLVDAQVGSCSFLPRK